MTGASGSLVIDNAIQDNLGAGVRIEAGSTNNSIGGEPIPYLDSKGNLYTGSFDPPGNSIGENGGPGIRIEGGSGTRMIGNHFLATRVKKLCGHPAPSVQQPQSLIP